MQMAGLDLLDVDPFELVEDEEPFTGQVRAADAGLAELLDRALRIIAEYEKPSGRTVRRKARVAAHLPGQHSQDSHGNSVSSPNALGGFDVMDADGYASVYGEAYDDGGIDLAIEGETFSLNARSFEGGDLQVVIDLEDGKAQVLEDMDPESMRQLADDLDAMVDVDETEYTADAYDVVDDAESDMHGFYVAKYGGGDVRLAPGASEDDYLELTEEQARKFAVTLRNIADGHEEREAEREVQATRAARRSARVVAHGNHDQSTHGRKKGLSLPSVKTPAAPAKPAAKPAKKAAPKAELKPKAEPKVAAPKAPARKRAAPKAEDVPAKPALTARQAASVRKNIALLDGIFGNDRDKWPSYLVEEVRQSEMDLADADAAAATRKSTAAPSPRRKPSPSDFPAGSWQARIASGVTSVKKLSGPNHSSRVDLVEFGDGTRAVRKRKKPGSDDDIGYQHDAEELGAAVAQALELPAPKTHRAGKGDLYQDYVEQGELALLAFPDEFPRSKTAAFNVANSADGRKMALLDALIENSDRNPGNFFIASDGLIPIDHGMGWDYRWTDTGPTDASMPPYPRDEFGELLVDPNGGQPRWADNDYPPEYIASLQPRLAALRPEFERIGRPEWHERMMTRLDIIASHAKGPVTV